MEKLLWLVRSSELSAFQAQFNERLEDAIIHDELKRQAKWTQAIAVGDRVFIEEIERRVRGRQELIKEDQGEGSVLQEEHGTYFAAQNRPIESFEPSIPL